MKQARRPSETRQAELVEAALGIIARRGVSALTTRSLADAVGLTTGAIFRHFTSLDALLGAVVARVEVVLDGTYPPAGLPPLERLQRFVEARSAAVGAERGILRLMLSEQFHLALPAAEATRLVRAVARTQAFIGAALREGQADGSLRSDVGADALVPVVLGTLQTVARSAQGALRVGAPAETVSALFTLLRAPSALSVVPPKHPKKRSRP